MTSLIIHEYDICIFTFQILIVLLNLETPWQKDYCQSLILLSVKTNLEKCDNRS